MGGEISPDHAKLLVVAASLPTCTLMTRYSPTDKEFSSHRRTSDRGRIMIYKYFVFLLLAEGPFSSIGVAYRPGCLLCVPSGIRSVHTAFQTNPVKLGIRHMLC